MHATRPGSSPSDDASSDAIYVTDTRRRILAWNAAAERLTGFRAGQVVGRRCSDGILDHVDEAGRSLCLGLCPLAATIGDGVPRTTEAYLHHEHGHRVRVTIHVDPLLDDAGQVIGGLERFALAESRPSDDARLAVLGRLGPFDALTGLPGRRHLAAECVAGIARIADGGRPFALLLASLDGFEDFVADYGRDVADLALRTVADTLRGAVRPTDLLARWDDSVFAVLLAHADEALEESSAERLRNLVRTTRVECCRLGSDATPSTALRVTASLGGALAGADDDLSSLVDRATLRLRASQGAGRNRVTLR
ncbi:MAG: GGDEF domain-containing protein [Myxococcales bacterium]|nr:GGDEF domain-containing protein [Myxococcales bacterium]